MRTFPTQERDRTVFHALEAVNADGHKFDVFVKTPTDAICRPIMVAFQDVYSGKILAWRYGETESSDLIRLALADMVRKWGIPRHVLFDNGRGFASKLLTGGAENRYRFKVRPEDPLGIVVGLGCKVHWATPFHGQAKPIERAFKDLCEDGAKHPEFAGAYTGNSPTAKPDNYGSKAVPLDTFLAVVSEGIAEHNAREGRRSPTCAGRSFDATFEASYVSVPIRRATGEQRRLWLMAAEAVRVRSQDGTIHLFGNRYWSEFLLAHRGSQVVVRFDPQALAEPLHVYAADGRYLGGADCQEAAGFDSVEAAQTQARRWKQFLRATKQATEIQDRMSIDELARRLPKIEAAEPPEPKLVRPLFAGNAALRAEPNADRQQDDEARVLRALRASGARPEFRVIEDEDE
jgi:hypothetical protein